jgi:hypothetical protein
MKRERYTKQHLSGLCDEYAEQCYFCPAISDCPMSDFSERKVEENKIFPFVEEMIYGKTLPIS